MPIGGLESQSQSHSISHEGRDRLHLRFETAELSVHRQARCGTARRACLRQVCRPTGATRKIGSTSPKPPRCPSGDSQCSRGQSTHRSPNTIPPESYRSPRIRWPLVRVLFATIPRFDSIFDGDSQRRRDASHAASAVGVANLARLPSGLRCGQGWSVTVSSRNDCPGRKGSGYSNMLARTEWMAEPSRELNAGLRPWRQGRTAVETVLQSRDRSTTERLLKF